MDYSTNKVPTEYEEQCLLFKWIRENEEHFPCLKCANFRWTTTSYSYSSKQSKRNGMVIYALKMVSNVDKYHYIGRDDLGKIVSDLG